MNRTQKDLEKYLVLVGKTMKKSKFKRDRIIVKRIRVAINNLSKTCKN